MFLLNRTRLFPLANRYLHTRVKEARKIIYLMDSPLGGPVANDRTMIDAIESNRFDNVETLVEKDDKKRKSGSDDVFTVIQYKSMIYAARGTCSVHNTAYTMLSCFAISLFIPPIFVPSAPIYGALFGLACLPVIASRAIYVNNNYRNIISMFNARYDIIYRETHHTIR